MRLALAILLAVGCGDPAPPAPPPAPPTAPVRVARVDATDLFAKYECARCHDVPGVATAVPDKHCVRCHQQIHAGTFDAEPALLAKWQQRITSLRWVPSLAGSDRLRRAWVREFLRAPHDVRPGLVAEMPRLAISAADAERLAAHLVPNDDDDGDGDGDDGAHGGTLAGEVARGEQLYRALACGRCHRFTGARVDDPQLTAAGRAQAEEAWALAPDLRHARARLRPDAVAAWIVAPRGAMPVLGVSAADAQHLARFVLQTPLAPAPTRDVPARLAVLSRAVTWSEVEAKVFRRVCWHCHAVPDFARGDGGPGNSGGFGFPARGLDLSSYAGISSGSLDDAGEPRSVFARLPDGTPRIVAHLHARHAEAAGQIIDGVRGMPLGLPPLALEDIQLVESWIAQGRPR